VESTQHDRLYKDVARLLMTEIANGRYPVGSKLPAEREISVQFGVSRPTVREAIIALEVRGLVEVRVGAGAFVTAEAGEAERGGFDISAIELTEARLLIEAETSALAATLITDEEVEMLSAIVRQIEVENLDPSGAERADAEFHHAIAAITRNNALIEAVDRLWELRRTSAEAALLHEKARSNNIKPVVEEHSRIVEALATRDPVAAREAMRAHLNKVLESLLFATEERAIAEARRSTLAKRDRVSRLTA